MFESGSLREPIYGLSPNPTLSCGVIESGSLREHKNGTQLLPQNKKKSLSFFNKTWTLFGLMMLLYVDNLFVTNETFNLYLFHR